jgi:mitogen-activated protein kinase organizer 1
MKLPTKEKQTLEGHYGPVNIAYFNNDGQYVLSGGQDKSVKLWSVLKENQGGRGVCLKTYSGHGREIYDIAITNDNSKFATCGGDKAVFYWDVMTGRTIRRYQGHYQRINCVDFNKEASVVVSGSSDMSIRIWDCRSQSRLPIQILEDAKDSITSLQVSDHEILAS